jgi:hypothetical protein
MTFLRKNIFLKKLVSYGNSSSTVFDNVFGKRF